MPGEPLDLRSAAHPAPPERDAALRSAVPGACDEAFPDDEGSEWTIEATAHGGDRAWVRVRGGEGHYVLLAVFGGGGELRLGLALYEAEPDGSFALLATEPDCPDDIPRAVIW